MKLNKRGIISLKKLKQQNYYLYKFYLRNKDLIDSKLFLEHGMYILDDIHGQETDGEYLRRYLIYHYGKTVNITELRKKDYNIYCYMFYKCGGVKYFKTLGFKIVYDKKDYVFKELEKRADKDGYIEPIHYKKDYNLYYALYMRAKKQGKSLNEYINELGYKIRERIDTGNDKNIS